MKTLITILISLFLLSCEKEIVKSVAIQQRKAAAEVMSRGKLSILLLIDTLPGSEYTADGCVAFFDTAFRYSIGNEDSYKWSNPDENIAIVPDAATDTSATDYLPTKMLSIDGQPYPAKGAADTIPLYLYNFRQENYYLKFEMNGFPTSVTAYLLDTTTGTTEQITDGFLKAFTRTKQFSLVIKHE